MDWRDRHIVARCPCLDGVIGLGRLRGLSGYGRLSEPLGSVRRTWVSRGTYIGLARKIRLRLHPVAAARCGWEMVWEIVGPTGGSRSLNSRDRLGR